MNNSGLLITTEGIDGSGKTSLAISLEKSLKEKNIDVILTKEPGSTELGSKIREILHSTEFKTCPKAEYLLFASDRAQNFEKVIKPALKENKVIISDRSGYSSLAYQGYGRNISTEMIKNINSWATDNIPYDLIFYIKIDIQTAIERFLKRGHKLTSFEIENQKFWEKVSTGFEEIFKDMNNVVILDGKKSIEELTEISTSKVIELWKHQQH